MVFADCADQAVCLYKYDGPQGQTEDRVGIIDTPTCWKVGEHCRPWHCKGNDTSSDYWISKCMRQFLMQHTIGRSKEKACVTFPNVKTSVTGANCSRRTIAAT